MQTRGFRDIYYSIDLHFEKNEKIYTIISRKTDYKELKKML